SLVAARVIDMFEAVEIEEEDGQHRARALGFVDGAREVRREIEAIRKARELVVVSEMIEVLLLFQELRLGFATYGDVVSGQRKKPARAQLQGLHAELDRAERAIFRTLLNLEGRSGV